MNTVLIRKSAVNCQERYDSLKSLQSAKNVASSLRKLGFFLLRKTTFRRFVRKSKDNNSVAKLKSGFATETARIRAQVCAS